MSPLDAADSPAEWLEARWDAAGALRGLRGRLRVARVRAHSRCGYDSAQLRTVVSAQRDVCELLLECEGEGP